VPKHFWLVGPISTAPPVQVIVQLSPGILELSQVFAIPFDGLRAAQFTATQVWVLSKADVPGPSGEHDWVEGPVTA